MAHSVGSGKAHRRQLAALVVVGLASLLVVGCNKSDNASGGDIQKDMGSGVSGQSDGSKAKAGASSLKAPATAGDPAETFVKPGPQ
jgi:hypothetical protein